VHLQGLGLATQLTSLNLECPVSVDGMYDKRYDEPVCAAFSRLARLQRLSLDFISTSAVPPKCDCLALTALTGLTHLSLVGAHGALGDNGAVALACCLKQLRHLQLESCSLGYCACTAAIAHLSQLTFLSLANNEGLRERQLMQLTTLQQLQELEVWCTDVSRGGEDRFWSALRGRPSI
jgi:Leucine-rich repeat (LRR) protein